MNIARRIGSHWALSIMIVIGLLARFDGPATPAAAADCTPVGHLTENSLGDALAAVAAVGPADVWAVGASGVVAQTRPPLNSSRPFAAHWQGIEWVASPLPALPADTPNGRLNGLAASAGGVAVAVGTRSTDDTNGVATNYPLALFWDGHAWSVRSTPSMTGTLRAVGGVGPGDLWAVGSTILHDTGDGFTQAGFYVSLPAGTLDLRSVAATRPDDVWAAGRLQLRNESTWYPLLLHGTGNGWEIALGIEQETHLMMVSNYATGLPAGFAPQALAAVPGQGGVWAVGNGAAHWDGYSWQAVPVPTTRDLVSVAVTAAGDAWATTEAIQGEDGGSQILHWDGTAWRLVSNPITALPVNTLSGIAVEAPGDVWAVGNSVSLAPGWSTFSGIVAHVFSPCGLPTSRVADPHQAGVRYFPEVGHTLRGPFLDYWNAHGGLAQFGYPITEEYQERNATDGKTYRVQYFQRNRFEYHPENAGTPYAVLLGLLGRTVTANRAGDPNFAPLSTPPPGARFFPPTGHNLAPEFAPYWAEHGGLAVYGYPISEPFTEYSGTDSKPYLVQYFERNRLELHPELPSAFRVSLGLLGADILTTRGWLP